MSSLNTHAIQSSFELPEYKFVPLSNVFKQSVETNWLIEDYIPKPSVGMLYGPSGTGKSHIALHMAACIANGIQWCSKTTEQGVVLVMAGEGHGGLTKRLKSIEKHHEIEINQGNIFFSERAIGVDTEDGFKDLMNAIEALDEKPDLIIIDTLSRHLMKSSENSNEDMAYFINKLEQIKQAYDTSIMIVHHTGKNQKSGSRGASSIRANIDFSLVLKPFEFNKVRLSELFIEKQKDADDRIPELSFRVTPVELDEEDKNGKKIKGACVAQVGFMSKTKSEEYEEIAVECFESEKPQWQKNFVEAVDDGDLSLASKKRKFRDTVNRLVENGIVKEVEPKIFALTSSQ
ncbi:AAA family ATPase [Neptuniibacter sp.]|uniref:AAA family ATPase n=1 Tax=Neptuniibacter sp. TaxID=1962643 RepID=UPI00261019CD|nr:AAA family ATPase [Neptuniibacter sp.]MCP4596140.1 AAA family ATPase [Neptuniibacter sp.]